MKKIVLIKGTKRYRTDEQISGEDQTTNLNLKMKTQDQELPTMDEAGPGIAPQQKIEAIEKAAEKYRDIRDRRMELTKQEVDSKAVLASAMHAHSLTRYVYGDTQVICEPGKEKVRVRSVDSPAGDEHDE